MVRLRCGCGNGFGRRHGLLLLLRLGRLDLLLGYGCLMLLLVGFSISDLLVIILNLLLDGDGFGGLLSRLLFVPGEVVTALLLELASGSLQRVLVASLE